MCRAGGPRADGSDGMIGPRREILNRIVRTESFEQCWPDDRLPAVTCVMAAADEAALIERKLRLLFRQDYPREKLSILVVSDASTDAVICRLIRSRSSSPRLTRKSPASGSGMTLLSNPNLSRISLDVG